MEETLEPLPELPSSIDAARAAAYLDARAGAPPVAGHDVEELGDEAVATVVDWARAAVTATRRPAAVFGEAAGQVALALALAGIEAIVVAPSELTAVASRRALDQASAAAATAEAPAPRRPFWDAVEPPKEAAAPDAAFSPQAPPRVEIGTSSALPFPDGSLGAVLDIGARRHTRSGHAASREAVRALASGGAFVIVEIVERESDRSGFFNALEQSRRPVATARFGHAASISGPAEAAGLLMESVAFFRVRKTLRDIALDSARGGQMTDLTTWSALLAGAPAEIRQLYEIDEESMSWRQIVLLARKP